jgi:hypothetical protein
MIFVGDCHGLFPRLGAICRKHPCDIIVQLGDMGIGFGRDNQFPAERSLRWIRGNHDNPAISREMPGYLGDYGRAFNGAFFVSGAYSMDKNFRTPGLDWWLEEELTPEQSCAAIALYGETKPSIVFSHDCPEEIQHKMVPGRVIRTRTTQVLQEMLERHRPDMWIFAHYHSSKTVRTKGTEFVALSELEEFTVDGLHEIPPL